MTTRSSRSRTGAANVDSTARAHRNVSRTRTESGMSDAEWWSIVAPVLDQVMADDNLIVSA
ncbi:hypothetical protein [Pseudonocardia sp. TRM90224]|uniref:hypothetical protein n=1 Tax=Pseudonocardia sp. TRM90224 TaxID=2812678 RepID=UPI001E4DBB5A|nr:hypothetical protein [Pseudonocardia sp. TRM90224]